MKKEDIEKYNVTVTGLNESDMSTKDALAAGYITQTGFAESINSTTAGDPVASGSEGHSETNPTPGSEGHSETNPAPGSTSETTGSNPTEGHSETNPASGSEGHSETNPAPGSTSETTGSNPTEGHSETNPAPGSTSETTGSNPTEGHSETNPTPGSEGHSTGASSETGNTTTIGGTEFPNDKSVFVANAGSALIKIATLSSKDLDSLVSLYKLDQESTWPSATDWKKMNVVTKRSTVKSALGLA